MGNRNAPKLDQVSLCHRQVIPVDPFSDLLTSPHRRSRLPRRRRSLVYRAARAPLGEQTLWAGPASVVKQQGGLRAVDARPA
jgi:hypothetical protein